MKSQIEIARSKNWKDSHVVVYSFQYDQMTKTNGEIVTLEEFTQPILATAPYLKLLDYTTFNKFDLKCFSTMIKKGVFNWLRWKTIDLSELKFKSRQSKANIQLVVFLIDKEYSKYW